MQWSKCSSICPVVTSTETSASTIQKKYDISSKCLRTWAGSGKLRCVRTGAPSGSTTPSPRQLPATKRRRTSSKPATPRKGILYARVSSSSQKEDSGRQVEFSRLSTQTRSYPRRRIHSTSSARDCAPWWTRSTLRCSEVVMHWDRLC